jgi:hypothetical protein
MQHDTPRYSTIHHDTARYTTIQHDTPWDSTINHYTSLYSTTQHDTARYTTIQHDTAWYNTIKHNTLRYSTIQRGLMHPLPAMCSLSAAYNSHNVPIWIIWFSPSLIYAHFWNIIQCIVVTPYRRFGTTYRYHLQVFLDPYRWGRKVVLKRR